IARGPADHQCKHARAPPDVKEVASQQEEDVLPAVTEAPVHQRCQGQKDEVDGGVEKHKARSDSFCLSLWQGVIPIRGRALLKSSAFSDRSVAIWPVTPGGLNRNPSVGDNTSRYRGRKNSLPERLGREFRARDELHQGSETPGCGASQKLQSG